MNHQITIFVYFFFSFLQLFVALHVFLFNYLSSFSFQVKFILRPLAFPNLYSILFLKTTVYEVHRSEEK